LRPQSGQVYLVRTPAFPSGFPLPRNLCPHAILPGDHQPLRKEIRAGLRERPARHHVMAHMLARMCATWGPGLIVPPFAGAIPIGAILTLHGDGARWQLPGKEPGIEDIIGVLEFAIGLFGRRRHAAVPYR